MEVKIKKQNSLFWMFLKQVLWMSLCILIEVVVFVGGFSILLNRGIILPANYAEDYLTSHREEIAETVPFRSDVIPNMCQYGLFDSEGSYLEGNLKEKQIVKVEDAIKNETSISYHFISIKRGQETCIILYDVLAHFASPKLHKLFPNPEVLAIILFMLIFILIITWNAFYFGKKLRRELQPLIEEVEEIKRQELTLKERTSSVTEFSRLLEALTDMKTALSESLEKEWKTEQRRKDNISSLAHDIKTPLTIIKGNAELIREEENISDIYEYADDINANTDKIERYIRLLIEETKNKEEEENELIPADRLAEDMISQSSELCKSNQVTLFIKKGDLQGDVKGKKDRILRALMNVLMNAVEYTKNAEISLSCHETDGLVVFEIEDFGNGFTPEALKHAPEQFYTERKERQGEHYGLGLYFAACVAKEHQGSLSFYNKKENGGAVVIWSLPLYGKD